jgi:hypothetical protein
MTPRKAAKAASADSARDLHRTDQLDRQIGAEAIKQKSSPSSTAMRAILAVQP